MKIMKTPEKVVVEAVRDYLGVLKERLEGVPSTSKIHTIYSIKSEYIIQMGSTKKKADVVLLKKLSTLLRIRL